MKTTKETKITLLSWTMNPLETIYSQWFQSRKKGPVPLPEEINNAIIDAKVNKAETEPDYWEPASDLEQEVLKVFNEVVDMDMPLGQTLYFTFLVENMPVALREQWVRHKIGHQFGDQLGADTIPDRTESTFWSQTMRTMVVDRFAADGDYLTPDWLKENGAKPITSVRSCVLNEMTHAKALIESAHGPGAFDTECPSLAKYLPIPIPVPGAEEMTVAEFYHAQFGWIQSAYNRLIASGMPVEDARNILPMGLQHSMTVTMNFATIKGLLSKRGCWISQLGMWRPVIEGITRELVTKVHPAFDRLIQPPCIGKDDKFHACPFEAENKHLVNNTDLPPCSLWINKEQAVGIRKSSEAVGASPEEVLVGHGRMPRYQQRKEHYASLWRRDPVTGERTKVG